MGIFAMGVEISKEYQFLEWLDEWYDALPDSELARIVGGSPDRVTIVCVDLTNGFCKEGALASKRVGAIVAPIRRLMVSAHELGVRSFLLPQDSHPADSPEFASWPPHCVTGTVEAETVPELEELEFSDLFHVMPKHSISSSLGTELDRELDVRQPRAVICVGDCTDLCLYQLAMHIRLKANSRGQSVDVIVPEDCVETYDLPIEIAKGIGAMPHPGDLIHKMFLYHLALNGVRVVGKLV